MGFIGRVHQLFKDFEKACDSVMREVLYSVLIKFYICMKLVTLISMCLKETYNKVRINKNLSDSFPIQNDLKQRHVLPPLLFSFASEYAIKKVEENQKALELNGTHHLLVYVGDNIRECIQKFPDWPLGARTANGTALCH
jgi:hypothetical protein